MVIGKTFLIALPVLILPLIIRFSVVEGVATATEVSPVGVVYSLLVGPIFYKKLRCARWLALSQTNQTGRD